LTSTNLPPKEAKVIEFPTADILQLKRLDEIDWDKSQEWDMSLGKPHGVVGDNGVPYGDINGNPAQVAFETAEQARNDFARYKEDKINPDHYRKLPMEAIEITEHFNFCLGNALKYIIRCEHKGDKKSDLAKAIWYLQRELARS
jgi:hypothetical protein